MSKRFSDFFDSVDKVEEYMEAADRAATSEQEREFIDTLYEKFEEYGMDAFLSQAQHDWFIRLAYK